MCTMTRVALITGSSGFVGQHLIKALVARGWGILHYDLTEGQDICDYEQLRSVLEHENPDAVFHLAAQAYVAESTVDPERTMRVNTQGTHTLLRALHATGSRAHVLLAGTSEEYGYESQPGNLVTELSPCFPMTVYGASKLAATALGQVYHEQYGMHIVCSRAWNHTGPGQSGRYALSAFARRIAESEVTGNAIRVGNLKAVRNFTDVRDIARAYIELIDADPGIYNVANVNGSYEMAALLDMMLEQATRNIPVMEDPHLWRPSSSEHFPAPVIAKLATHTRWEPEIGILTMLADLLDYWRDR
jgi:GDP-4-dehydro-6-deoxy-D-mannose reductase